jgi:TP901 family phage tail tape measure protein
VSLIGSQLIAEVSVRGAKEAASQLMGVGSASDSAGALLGKLALGGVAIAGAALIGIGVMATKMAADFRQSMTLLVTSAGESASNLKMVSAGILSMAVDTGTSTALLAQGMYMVESAGFHGAAALTVLAAAARGARVENADLETVAKAVTTVMTDYGLKASQSGDAMNFLTAIVQHGKVRLQELAGAMSQVLPAASAVGVHLFDVGAAMATMTGEGVGAAQAATYLRQLLIALSAPAHAGAAALKAIGLTTGEVAATMKKSLPDALKLIMDHLAETYTVGSPEYVAALKAIAGGSKQMQGILDLTGTHLADLYANLRAVTGAVNQNKGSIMGWSEVQGNFNFKLSQVKEIFEVLLIQLGTKLLPILGQLLGKITPMLTAFSQWALSSHGLEQSMNALGTWLSTKVAPPVEHLTAVLIPLIKQIVQGAIHSGAFQAAIGMLGAAIPVIVSWFTKFVEILAKIVKWVVDNQIVFLYLKGVMIALAAVLVVVLVAALVLVGITLAAVAIAFLVVAAPIIGVIWLIQHLGDIGRWFAGVWKAVMNWFGGIITWVADQWKAGVARVVGWFTWLYNHNYIFQNIVNFIHGVMVWITNFLHAVWDTAVHNLITNWQKVVDAAKTLWNNVTGVFRAAWGMIVQPLLTIAGNLISWASGLAGKAHDWGISLIQGFINGIIAKAQDVANAVADIAAKVAGILGFHSSTFGVPEEGPAKHADTWMPALIKGLVGGLEEGIPQIERVMGRLMTPLAVNANVGYQVSGLSRPSAPTVIVQSPPIFLDGRRLDRALMPHHVDNIRLATGKRM